MAVINFFLRAKARGQALVEMALLLVILVPLTFAVVDWGLYAYRQTVFNTVVTDAARQAITWPGWFTTATNSQNHLKLNVLVKKRLVDVLGVSVIGDVDGYIATNLSLTDTDYPLIVEIKKYPHKAVLRDFTRVPEYMSAKATMAVFNERAYR